MEALMQWYNNEAQTLYPVERAARLHVDFLEIQPFVDGNDRSALLIMNLELMKAGYPSVVVPVEDRLAYYDALDTAHCTQDYEAFLGLMESWVKGSFVPYFKVLGVNLNA